MGVDHRLRWTLVLSTFLAPVACGPVACGSSAAQRQAPATAGGDDSMPIDRDAAPAGLVGTIAVDAGRNADFDSGSPDGDSGSSGDASSEAAAPHVVTPCPTNVADTSDVGNWEDVTPPFVAAHPSMTGILVPLVNPLNTSVVYATSDSDGVFKSTDCGATWVMTNTGRNASAMKSGRQWNAALDPVNPQILYVINGYGAVGLWKTTNGGVDWDQLFASGGVVAKAVPSEFTESVAIDPTDHQHILVNFHDNCSSGNAPVCFAESKDAGATWNIVQGPTSGWAEASGMIMIDSQSWLYATWFAGLWHSANAGATWQNVTPSGATGASPQLFHAADGTYFLGTLQGVTSSKDGVTWSLIPNSGSNVHAMIGDSKRLFGAQQNGNNLLYSAPANDPTNWNVLTTPGLTVSPYLFAYDPDHHLLYGSLQKEGLTRVRTY